MAGPKERCLLQYGPHFSARGCSQDPYELISGGLNGLEAVLKGLLGGNIRAKKRAGRIADTPDILNLTQRYQLLQLDASILVTCCYKMQQSINVAIPAAMSKYALW